MSIWGVGSWVMVVQLLAFANAAAALFINTVSGLSIREAKLPMDLSGARATPLTRQIKGIRSFTVGKTSQVKLTWKRIRIHKHTFAD